MKRAISALLLLSILISASMLCSCSQKKKFSAYSFDCFDTVTTVTGYASSQEEFDEVSKLIFEELKSYHQLFTIYERYDGINNLCTVNSLTDGKHTAVKVDQKIIDMLLFCKEAYEITDGKVNVAMGSVLSIWHEHREAGLRVPESATLPNSDRLQEAAQHTDINAVIIDENAKTVFLSDPDMLLDVGAIAKGYAVEAVAQKLEAMGINGYVLNAGGNVRTLGIRGDGKPWVAGIEDPYAEDNAKDPYYAMLELTDLSLVTSGSYQRYYTVNGVNYNHIIDPQTLMPSNRYTSVSIVTKSSALADALSTALFCMSFDDGSALIEATDGVEAMWVLKSGEIHYSSGFSNYVTK